MIPLMLVLFTAVKRHYVNVTRELACPTPLDTRSLRTPIVVVPVKGWDRLANKSLRFAIKLSSEVYAVQVRTSDTMDDLQALWPAMVEAPLRAIGLPPPQLDVSASPYRRLVTPLLDYITRLKDEHPERQIAVIIPDLVEHHWSHYLLHNQQGEVLKALLLLQGDQRVVVVNVPWYLKS